MIGNKRLYFKTKSAFEVALTNGNIDPTSIALIEDKQLVWTHNKYFSFGQELIASKANSSDVYTKGEIDEKLAHLPQENTGDGIKHIFLEPAQYASLTEYEPDAIYFVYEDNNEEPQIWVLGD